jgi:hypothetical protein|tara:strand:+ start:193 stop:357 length:165 start_codon:yes stop_codon:yes gene_type:complete
MNKKEKEEELKRMLNVTNVSIGKTWRKKYATSKSADKGTNKKGIKGMPTNKTRR